MREGTDKGEITIKIFSNKELKAFKADVEKWEGKRGERVLNVISDAKQTDLFLLAVKRVNNEVMGVMSIYETPDDKWIEIGAFATKEKGHGRSMMQEVINRAGDEGKGIALTSTFEAIGFYKRMGMEQGNRSTTFSLSSEKCKKMSTVQKEISNDVDDFEPEDGVFAVRIIDGDIIGDGMIPIDKDYPDYENWLKIAKRK